MDAARQAWLAAHPWLAPLSRLHERVDEAVARAPMAAPPVSAEAWDDERAAGVPLLQSAAGRAIGDAAPGALAAVIEALASADVPGPIGAACRALRDAFADPRARAGTAAWIFEGTGPGAPPPHLGFARLVGWSTLRRLVSATLARTAPLRSEESWGHTHCPTCGARPGLARLADDGGARTRVLACGCCGTRWPWRRIGCPFCGNESLDRLGVLEADGAVRLDVCEGCRGYVKTCVGDGDAELLLADWPTLHLDLAARSHGLERMGASLYEL
jgi:FdhE protein